MFTGLIQCLGRIVEISSSRLRIDDLDKPWVEPLGLGESICVNGCCLTVVGSGDELLFDLSEETLNRTSFGTLTVGALVNLERAMRPVDRFGGHIVQGHVDCTAKCVQVSAEENSWIYRFQVPPEFDRYLIDKGSIALDGISLTVVRPEDGRFETWIIPHTMQATNLRALAPGDTVNAEFDVLAKHVEKLLRMGPSLA